MANDVSKSQDPSNESPRRWPSYILMALLLGGLATAAVRAVESPTTDRERTLVLLAPPQGKILLQGAADPTSTFEGTHTFTVMPGPYTLEVRMPETPPMTTEIQVPRGIGGLMMTVEVNPDRSLELGYF